MNIHIWNKLEINNENRKRHEDAKKTWKATYTQGGWKPTPIEPGMFGRDATHKTVNDKKRHPFIKDCIRAAIMRGSDSDVVCITRSDSCFGVVDRIPQGVAGYSYRATLDHGQTEYHPFAEFFFFTKQWYNDHRASLPDCIMGDDRHWQILLKHWITINGGVEIEPAVYREKGSYLPIPKNLPPHTLFNEKVVNEFMAKHKIERGKPPIDKQLQTKLINPQALFPFGYNGSVIRYATDMLLAYRSHPERSLKTAIAVATLNPNIDVVSNSWVDIKPIDDMLSQEDPRLFIYRGDLWMSWVSSSWPMRKPTAIVRYAKLWKDGGNWRVDEGFRPNYGHNHERNAIEKNWVFFDQDGKLYCIYSSSPNYVVLEVNGNEIVRESSTDPLRWPYGSIRGGTPPVRHGDKLLRFFHSHMVNENPPMPWRYYMGWCLTEPQWPFKILKVSEKPILIGAEQCCGGDVVAQQCAHYKGNVVFPAGVMRFKDSWLVSVGNNDAECAIVRVMDSQVA